MLSVKVTDVIPLENKMLLVFFEDDSVKRFDVGKLMDAYPEFDELEDDELFQSVKVEAGGYGISWNSRLDCSEGELYENGIDVLLCRDDFIRFVKYNLVNTKEATEILGCSKQNIDDLVKRGKLKPIKSGAKYKLYLKSEIQKRRWE